MYNYQCSRFAIRPFVMDDLEQLVDAANDPLIAKVTNLPYPFTKEDGQIWLVKQIDSKKMKSKGEINFAITVKDTIVGSIGIKKLETHRAEIGYWLADRFRGQGIAQKALQKITTFAFSELAIIRLEAYTLPDNIASQKVLEKNLFHKEGLLHKYLKHNDNYFDCIVYAKIKLTS